MLGGCIRVFVRVGFGELANEAIAATVRRFNVTGGSCAILQRFPELPDRTFQNCVTHESAGPDYIQHLVGFHKLPWALNQNFENRKSFWPQGYRARAVPQALVGE